MGDSAPYVSEAKRRQHLRGLAEPDFTGTQRTGTTGNYQGQKQGKQRGGKKIGGGQLRKAAEAKAKGAALVKKHSKKTAAGPTVAQLKVRIRTHNKKHCLKLSGSKVQLQHRVSAMK